MRFDGFSDRRCRASKERVGAPFLCHQRWERGLPLVPSGFFSCRPSREIGIIRIDLLGESNVGERVFVRAVYSSVVRELSQPFQRSVQLPRRSIPKAATTASENRITREKHTGLIVCNVLTRVPWDANDLQLRENRRQ